MSTTNHDVAILGGGIGGLTLAYRAAKLGLRVVLVESARLGGVIRSERKTGYLLERGPNSFTSFPSDIMALIGELGLGARALRQPMRIHDRFVWKNGALRLVPTGPGAFVTSDVLGMGEKLAVVRGLFRAMPAFAGDVAMGAFFRARIGDAAVESLLKPFMAGIYAADADRVSLEATFPKLHAAAAQGGSLMQAIKAMRGPKRPGEKKPCRELVSFPDGLVELADALGAAARAAGATIHEGTMPELRRDGDAWRIAAGGAEFSARAVVCAAPAGAAAEILGTVAPQSAAALAAIEYSRLTVVHAGIDEGAMGEKRNGFGFLSVPDGSVRVLGIIWSDRLFANRAPAGKRLLTCFYGGKKDPEANTWDDSTVTSQLIRDLKATMKLNAETLDFLEITRWDRAIPVFRLGHAERMRAAVAALPPGVHVLGNYLGGVSIPDRVATASRLAEQLSSKGGPA